MSMWSQIALALTGLQGLWCLICLCRRELPRQTGETARFPWGGGFVALSMVLEALMAAFVVAFALLGAGGVELLFALFQLLATALVTEACMHVVVLTDEGFVIRTHFGRVHACRWEDVLCCTGDPKSAGGATSLKTKDRRFFLSFLPPTNMALLGMINAGRKERGLGPLPVRKASLDPFDGHVQDWAGMLFAYALVLAVGLSMMGLCGYGAFTPITEANTQRVEVAFTLWGAKGADRINFYDAQGMAYRVSYNLAGMEPVKAACGTGTTFAAHVRLARPDDEPDYYRIFALTSADGSETYMSFEHSNAAERKTWLMAGGIFAALTAVWVLYIVRSIQVGRHPDRYSRKIIRWYFKDGYVR